MPDAATPDLVRRLLELDVSALCDADKNLPVLDPAVRAMVPGVRMAGPAVTVFAPDDHLPVLSALAEAGPGDVLVVQSGPASVALFGELFATEARRRGLAGIVCDGFCRDLAGLREIGLPVFARGTTPMAGSTVSRSRVGAPVRCGGVEIGTGDVVFGDDDGVIAAPAWKVAEAIEAAEGVAAAERAVLAALAEGRGLHELTSWAEHVAALDAGEPSRLEFRPDGG